MSEAVLDFNRTVHREQHGSDQINGQIDGALTRKRANQPRRDYLGASAVGGPCERAIQFEYAGATPDREIQPRFLRIFDRGHMGEELARAWLSDAGYTIVQRNQRTGELYAFSQMNGRFRGHVDGVVIEAPEGFAVPALWEAKTLGGKGWREIEKLGLRKARPAYYAQVQIYMAYLGLTENPALFTATNADTCEQLHLLIPFDAEEAQRASDRAVRIISATEAGELLPRPFKEPSHFECRRCAFADRCWGLGQ
jgi:hypothetical protein